MPASSSTSESRVLAGLNASPAASLSPGTDRTLTILEALAKHPAGLTLAELVRTLELPQNSVFRITATLHERGYLHRREADKRFVLSNKLFDLVRPRVNDKSLAVCAYEALRELRDRTGETVQLFVRSGVKGVVLEQVCGKHPVKVMGEVGLRVPLYSCAPGKAILAWLPEEEYESWLSDVTLKKFTPTTRCTRELLRSDLAATRERGYTIDLEEGLQGIHCVGAPVTNDYEYPVAAVTVMAPAFRLEAGDFDEVGDECRKAAGKIRERLLA